MAPFKMKGFSPFHQEEKEAFVSGALAGGGAKKGLKEKKTKLPKKFRLMSNTNKKTGETNYFKVSGGSSTDGGKTFTPTVKTKISKAEYDSMKGQ